MMALIPDSARTIFALPPIDAAERLYTLSRDLYAPVLAVFAARCLDTLAGRPRAINLCLARDGISAFVAQRLLLRLAPARFRRISPRRVRLVYLSRQLMAEALVEPATFLLTDRYLRAAGLRRGAPVTLVDVGIHGQLQDVLSVCYPECSLRGEYLIYRRRPEDTNAAYKRGLLAGDPEAPATAMTDMADTACFLRRESIHLLEDLWSGVYESVDALREESLDRQAHTQHRVHHVRQVHRVRPRLYRLGERSVSPLLGAELRRLKRAALRGVVDGVAAIAPRLVRRARAAEAAGAGGGVMEHEAFIANARRLGEWIAASRAPGSPDAWLWQALIRPDRGGTDDDW